MGERVDRVLDLLERLVRAAERTADAIERIATVPSGKLPPRRGLPAARVPPKLPERPIDELTRVRARRALERAGLR